MLKDSHTHTHSHTHTQTCPRPLLHAGIQTRHRPDLHPLLHILNSMEINKAFCGFFYQYKCQQYQRLFQVDGLCGARSHQDVEGSNSMLKNNILFHEALSTSFQTNEEISGDKIIRNFEEKGSHCLDHQDDIGIATGNWGCGAFGGDPELKATIQWLAASQALRPFILYYTFGVEALRTLEQVSQWIMSHEWSVGDLWNMLVEFSYQRLKGETEVSFFSWLLPSLSGHDPMILDVP